jgi:hypothetical protein
VLRSIALPHLHSHDCEHSEEAPTSTGFLPLSLALTLFVTGLFALGWVQCAPSDDFGSETPQGVALP